MNDWEVIEGDCLEVMRGMPDGSIDMVFTSPPYNLGVSSGGGLKGGTIWKNSKLTNGLANGYSGHDDAMPMDRYTAWQRAVLTECWRLLSPAGAIYYNHKPRVQNGILQTPLDFNPELPLRQIIIWARGGGLNMNHRFYLPTHEWIMVLAKDGFELSSLQAALMGDVWKVAPDAHSAHPAPFPVELPLRALQTTSGLTVLDPFCGSGTTGVAALMTGKRFIGIDNSAVYCEMARNRLRRSEGLGYTASFLGQFDEEIA